MGSGLSGTAQHEHPLAAQARGLGVPHSTPPGSAIAVLFSNPIHSFVLDGAERKSHANFTSAVVPGGQPSAAALETLGTSLTSSPYTWVVNIAAGRSSVTR